MHRETHWGTHESRTRSIKGVLGSVEAGLHHGRRATVTVSCTHIGVRVMVVKGRGISAVQTNTETL